MLGSHPHIAGASPALSLRGSDCNRLGLGFRFLVQVVLFVLVEG